MKPKAAESEVREWIVEASAEGIGGRLDLYLAAQLDTSRARTQDWIDRELVAVNGKIPKKSEPVEVGQRIVVRIPEAGPSPMPAEAIPLSIVFEDADLVVIDKQAGLVTHPAPGHGQGTLVNALLHHFRELSTIGGDDRPGIVHRLDRDTSGLLVVARNNETHRALADQLRSRKMKRKYWTLSWGHLRESPLTVDAPIGRHPSDRKRMGIFPDGKPSVTRFEVLEPILETELLRAELGTGRTHQIRVHLASIGHSVVGDAVYGVAPTQPWGRELARRVPRQFLHAAELRFEHPRSGETMRFRAPLPPDLAKPLAWARAKRDE